MGRLAKTWVQGTTIAFAVLAARADARSLRLVDVDASPAIDDAVPALRVTLAEGVSWGTERCAPPRTGLCEKPGPRESTAAIRFADGASVAIDAHTHRRSTALPTAWIVLVDAGAPVAPRWYDVRSAAFAWLEAVPREGDLIAVVMLGETRPVSRSPWFSFAERDRAREALGLQALPLMGLGRDEALGPVVDRALGDALHDLPFLPTSRDVPRVVAAVFTDGRTETAQAGLEARGDKGSRLPGDRADVERSRQVEIEAFWFPHDQHDPRADGTRGMLALTQARGRVHRIDGPYREAVLQDAAALARRPSDAAMQLRLERADASVFPALPAIEALGPSGAVVDDLPAGTLPLEAESWPMPPGSIVSDDVDEVLVKVPLPEREGVRHHWRAFWMPASDDRVAREAGDPVRKSDIEALVASDRELTLEPRGDVWSVHLDTATSVARAQEPLDLVFYDDESRRATPLRHDRALRLPKSAWTAPLIDGPRILRVSVMAVSVTVLVGWARLRRRRGIAA